MISAENQVFILSSFFSLFPDRAIVVRCPCVGCDPFPPLPDCRICAGTGKIMYAVSDVEAI